MKKFFKNDNKIEKNIPLATEKSADEILREKQEKKAAEKRVKQEKKAASEKSKQEQKAAAEKAKAEKKTALAAKKSEQKARKAEDKAKKAEEKRVKSEQKAAQKIEKASQKSGKKGKKEKIIEETAENATAKGGKKVGKKRFKRWQKAIVISLTCLVVLVGGAFTALKILMGGDGEMETFSVSGIVRVEGTPVANFEFDANGSKIVTDEKGCFIITGVVEKTTISLSDDTYYFGSFTKTFTEQTEGFIIDGQYYRALSGTVKNGDESMSGVTIKVTGDNGTFIITSDDDGNFSFDKAVGDIKIEAVTSDNKKLFGQEIKKDEYAEDVQIKASTSHQLSFALLDGVENANFSYEFKGQTFAFSQANGPSLSFDEVEYGDEIKFNSEEYGFAVVDDSYNVIERIDSIIIREENVNQNIAVFKKYGLSFGAVSGNVPISDVRVYVDGVLVGTTDAKGNLVSENSDERSIDVTDLISKHVVTVKKDGFASVGDIVINQADSNVEVNLKKIVKGTVKTDVERGKTTIYANGAELGKTDENGSFTVECEIGTKLTFAYDGYYIENDGETEVKLNDGKINVKGFKIFDAYVTVKGSELPNVGERIEIRLGGESGEIKEATVVGDGDDRCATVKIENLNGLNGTIKVEILTSGYEYSKDGVGELSYKNSTLTFDAVKVFSISGEVKSGDIKIKDAVIKLNGKQVAVTDGKGEFAIHEARSGNVITVNADGYDGFTQIVSSTESFVTANLTYSVTLGVKNDNGVSVKNFVLIDSNDKREEVNESVTINGLVGTNCFSFEKDHYEINGKEEFSVSRGGEFFVPFTYEITVKVINNSEGFANATVRLIDYTSGENETTLETKKTDINGEVKFSGLISKYKIAVDGSASGASLVLQITNLTVNEGGEYVFSDKGYNVKGVITCGGAPLKAVKVVAVGRTTYTDENGEYSFSMLTSYGTLTFYKEGYTFSENDISLTEENTSDENGFELAASATYEISGTVKSGETPIVGVSVRLGDYSAITDENGYYSISGLDLANGTLLFEKAGFAIASEKVSAYMIIDRTAYVNINVYVKSGDLAVSDAKILANGVQKTQFVLGDVITAQKTGYSFESVTLTLDQVGKDITVFGSYKISGSVTSNGTFLEGVVIKVNGEEKLTTNSDGKFEISGLVGTNVISFEREGYKINPVTVSDYDSNISATTTYDVVVYVKSGDLFVSGITVKVGNNTVITDKDGKAEFIGISGSNTVTCAKKDGYAFSGGVDGRVSSTTTVYFDVSYTVKGTVTSAGKTAGGITVIGKGADGNEIKTTTGTDGKYSLSGIVGEQTIKFSGSGYEEKTQKVTAPCDVNPSLGFKVSLIIQYKAGKNGSIKGINVSCGSEKITTENAEEVFVGKVFYESTTISFDRANTAFSRDSVTVDSPGQITIQIEDAFTVSGTITTVSGIPVVGMTITAGGKTTVTDSNGCYSVGGLLGEVTVSGKMDGCDHACAFNTEKISQNTTANYSSIADNNYAFALYEINYNNRLKYDGGVAFEIRSTGTVNAVALGLVNSSQNSTYVRKQDGKGNVLTQNLNHGDPVAGVDPKVALVSYYNGGNAIYSKTTGDVISVNGDKTGYVTSYSGGFNFVSDSEFKNQFGNPSSGILVYDVKQDYTTNWSTLALSQTENGYQMTIKLNDNATTGYKIQIQDFGNLSALPTFNYVYLTFTLDFNGWVTKVDIEENYSAKKMGVNADTTGKFHYDYTYYTVGEKWGNPVTITNQTMDFGSYDDFKAIAENSDKTAQANSINALLGLGKK